MEMLPKKPSDSDCCGSGCSPCVFEVYEKLLLECNKQTQSIISNRQTRRDLLSPIMYKPFELSSVITIDRTYFLYIFKPVTRNGNLEGFRLKIFSTFILTEKLIERVLGRFHAKNFLSASAEKWMVRRNDILEGFMPKMLCPHEFWRKMNVHKKWHLEGFMLKIFLSALMWPGTTKGC